MAYKIKSKKAKFTSEAEVFNEIEMRVRKGKPVSDKERRLLIEGYYAFGVPVPKDIQNKLKF